MKPTNRNCSFCWGKLVTTFLHPMKVAIVEALLWIDEPLSPKCIDHLSGGMHGVSLTAYHMRSLADAGVVIRVDQKARRGALQSYYELAPKFAQANGQ